MRLLLVLSIVLSCARGDYAHPLAATFLDDATRFTLPVALQRHLVGGLTAGGVKG